MTESHNLGQYSQKNRSRTIVTVALLNAMGVVFFAHFLNANGYLPSPFIYDKSDTLMDLFNPMSWAYDSGRYSEWGSIYPPLNFILLRAVNYLLGGVAPNEPHIMRDDSSSVILFICLLYLALPAMMLSMRSWRIFSVAERMVLYLAIIFSAPMLFALERGNLILLCPIMLACVLSRIGLARALGIALLINIKPYLAILMVYYVARRNWRGLVTCTMLSGLVFLITGLLLDDNFLLFFGNLLSFSGNEAIFSLREVMSFPSSVSAFSTLLNNVSGANFLANILPEYVVANTASTIEVTKWGAIVYTILALHDRAKEMRDKDIFVLLVVLTSNLGTWVGGYTLALYVALIPTLIIMRWRTLYFILIGLMVIPLDVLPLYEESIGNQHVFLTETELEVYWTLGLGSVLRPVLNLTLLLALSIEHMNANSKNNPIKLRTTIPNAADYSIALPTCFKEYHK